LALKTGKRTQFFGEIPAMIKGAVSREPLPGGLAMGSKIDVFTKPLRGMAGKIIGTPTRLLQVEDNLGKNLIGKMELAGQKYAGKTGEELIGVVNKEQLYRTFQNDAGVVANALLTMRSKIPALRYVIPFIKTPANLIARGLERTPLGAVKIARGALAKTYTQEELAKDLGNLSLGTAGAGWLGLQWAKGNVTGRAPTDSASRDAFYRQGKKPNAIRIGNKWIPLDRLEPLGTSFSTLFNLIQYYTQSKQDTPPGKAMEAIGNLGATLVNKTYLSGFTNLIKVLSDPEMYGEKYLQRLVSSSEPQIIKFFADLQDPYYREANSVLEQLKSKTPILSKTLPPKLNVFGEPVKRDFMNIGKVNESPLEKMIGETPVGFPRKTIGKDKLTSGEYQWLVQKSGTAIKKILEKIDVNKFNAQPLEIKEKIINAIETNTRTIPRGILRLRRKKSIDFQPIE
jgi:hypothetical protein